MTDLPAALLSKRKITDSGCWEWAGARDANGYGQTRWQGKKIRAHRLVAHLVHGLDLTNYREYARHTCDNPPCFNPEHIVPGTPKDNQQDAIRRARRIKTACKRGHPYTAENVGYADEGRHCRVCIATKRRENKQRRADQGIPTYWSLTTTCAVCGKEISKANIRRHEREVHGKSR